jgi:hypothetical protein
LYCNDGAFFVFELEMGDHHREMAKPGIEKQLENVFERSFLNGKLFSELQN